MAGRRRDSAGLLWTKASAPKRPREAPHAEGPTSPGPRQRSSASGSAAAAPQGPPARQEPARAATPPRQRRLESLKRKLVEVAPSAASAPSKTAVPEALCWRKGRKSDWSLRLGQKTFAVHQAVVGYGKCASAFLKAAFDAGGGPAKKTETDLSQLCPEAVWPLVEAVLDFTYTGKIDLKIDAMVGLLLWADVLKIDVLYEHIAAAARNIFCKSLAKASKAPIAPPAADDADIAEEESEYEESSESSFGSESRSMSSASSAASQRGISPPPGDFSERAAPKPPAATPAAPPAVQQAGRHDVPLLAAPVPLAHRRQPSPLKAPPPRQAERREPSLPKSTVAEKRGEERSVNNEASRTRTKASEGGSVGGPRPKEQVMARALAASSGGVPGPVPIGSRAKASFKKPPNTMKETAPAIQNQATSRPAKTENPRADDVPAGKASAPAATSTSTAISKAGSAISKLPVDPPSDIIAVRAENTWEKLGPVDSASADGTEGRREVHLRVFTSDHEVWRFPVTHTCVIFGCAPDSAHFADLTHDSIKSQHVALTVRPSNRFALEPINGKTRVRPAWSLPVIAHALEKERRPRPEPGGEEPADAELEVGGTRLFLLPGLSCFQLGKSKLTLFLDFLDHGGGSKASGGTVVERAVLAAAPASGAASAGSKEKADARASNRSHSRSNSQSSSASAASLSQPRARSQGQRSEKSQRSKRSARSQRSGARSPRDRSDPSQERGSSPGAATDEEENTWRSERVAMRLSSTKEAEKGPGAAEQSTEKRAGGRSRRHTSRRDGPRGKGHRERSHSRGGAEGEGFRHHRREHRGGEHRDRWRSRSPRPRSWNYRGRDRHRGGH